MKTKLYNSAKIGLVLLAATLSGGFASGATYTAVASGNWSSAATWGGSAPAFKLGVIDQITIGAGLTVTMDSTIIVNGILSQVTVNGTLTSGANSLILTSGTISGSGTIVANNIMLSTGSTFSFSGSVTANTLTNSIASLSSSAVIMVNNTLTLTGIISIQTGGSLTMAAASTVDVKGGSLSVSGGTLGLSSVYTVNYTASSTTAGMELSGSGLGNVTINVSTGNSVALGSNVTLSDSLKLLSGSLTLNGYNLTLNGQVWGSGTFIGDASANLVINTSGGLSSSIAFASSYQTLNNLTLNVGSGKSVTLASNLSVNGTLSLSGGSNLSMSGVKITLNGSFSGTGSLMVNDKSGIDIEGSSSIITPISLSGSLGNFILNVGTGNTVTLGTDMAVDTINLETGTLVLNGHNLSINGNIAAAGSGMLFSTSASTVTITAASSTAGAVTFSYPGNNVYNLTVNIGAAGSIMLGSDLVVNNNLVFISGYVNTGSHNLQIAAAGNITGANSNAYVITGAGGYLTMNATTAGTSTFYVGTAAHYSPASITLNTGSSTGTIGVNASSGVYSQGTTGTLISSSQPMVNSTWLFQTSITSGLNADMQLSWSPAIEVNGFIHTGDYISHYTAGAWDKIGDSLTATIGGSGMVSLQRKGITSMSPFAVFDQSTVTGINEIAVSGGFEIYPNPVSEDLNIRNNTGNTGFLYATIYNVLGEIVSTSTIAGTEAVIPVNKLAPGNYFIKLYNDKTTLVRKFIKI